MMWRTIRAILAAAVALLVMPAQAADPVRIGVLMPLTGNAASAGQASKAAIEVAATIITRPIPR